MRHLTVRKLPAALAEALEREKERRGKSMNQTVIELLAQSVGLGTRRSNGLASAGGTWSDEEHADFEAAIAVTAQVDEELWR